MLASASGRETSALDVHLPPALCFSHHLPHLAGADSRRLTLRTHAARVQASCPRLRFFVPIRSGVFPVHRVAEVEDCVPDRRETVSLILGPGRTDGRQLAQHALHHVR